MDKLKPSSGITTYLIQTIFIFLVMQALIILLHEFTHSTMAWLMGTGHNPLDIVWGNPVTMSGWDEGVSYKKLFDQGKGVTAAIIGISPLVMHLLMISFGLTYLCCKNEIKRKWLAQIVYWFVIANLMELVAYIFMRSFAEHGDTGIFTRGTGVSPWLVFILGGALVAVELWILFTRAMPRMQNVFFPKNSFGQWIVLLLTSFILFLWGSGLRVLAYISGPSSLFGVIGVILMIFTLIRFRPGARPGFQTNRY